MTNTGDGPKYINIEPKSLSSEAMEGLIKEFILREGTDYGTKVYTLEEKVQKIYNQINSNYVSIVYDIENESTTLIRNK